MQEEMSFAAFGTTNDDAGDDDDEVKFEWVRCANQEVKNVCFKKIVYKKFATITRL